MPAADSCYIERWNSGGTKSWGNFDKILRRRKGGRKKQNLIENRSRTFSPVPWILSELLILCSLRTLTICYSSANVSFMNVLLLLRTHFYFLWRNLQRNRKERSFLAESRDINTLDIRKVWSSTTRSWKGKKITFTIQWVDVRSNCKCPPDTWTFYKLSSPAPHVLVLIIELW